MFDIKYLTRFLFAILFLFLFENQVVGQLSINSTSPINGAVNIGTKSEILIDFNTPVDPVTFTELTFSVVGDNAGYVQGTTTFTGSQVQFVPDTAFFPGDNITVLLQGLKSVTTENLIQPYYFEFTVDSENSPSQPAFFGELIIDDIDNSGRDIETIDFDSDGDIDIIIASYSAILYFENNNNNFIKTRIYQGSYNVDRVEAVDFDRDGYMDLFTTDGENLILLSNDGTGTFIKNDLGYIGDDIELMIGDIDTNGFIDVVTSTPNDSNLKFFLNQGTNEFHEMELSTSYSGIGEVQLMDINRDFVQDLVFSEYGGNKISAYPFVNSEFGNQIFEIETQNRLENFQVFDSNLDGKEDIFVLTIYNDLEYFEYESDTSFINIEIDLNLTSVNQFSAADLDSDGDTDLYVASLDGIFYLENKLDGQLEVHKLIEQTNGTFAVAHADLNGNGLLDLVSMSINYPHTAIYENRIPLEPDLQIISSSDTVSNGSLFDFGSIGVGDTLTRIFNIYNNGEQNLKILDTIITNTDFSILELDTLVLGLNSGELKITFVGSLGEQESTLELITNDPDQSSYIINLLGTGVDAVNVVNISPQTNTNFIDPESSFDIDFSEVIADIPENRSKIKLYSSLYGVLETTISGYGSTELVVTSNEPLKRGDDVKILVHVDLLGDSGNKLLKPFSSQYQVASLAITSENLFFRKDTFNYELPYDANIEVADLYGDNALEILVPSNDDVLSLMVSDSIYTDSLLITTNEHQGRNIWKADLDLDGDFEIIKMFNYSNGLMIISNEDTLYQSVFETELLSIYDIDFDDFDGDGDLDILLSGGSIFWLKNEGDAFVLEEIYLGYSVDQVTLVDFNYDGLLDLAFTRPGTRYTYLFVNKGYGQFQESFGLFIDTQVLQMLDFDGDGDMDIFFNNVGSSILGWYENLGDFTFDEHQIFSDGNVSGYSTGFIDRVKLFDADGDMDFDLIYYFAETRQIFFAEQLSDNTFVRRPLMDEVDSHNSIKLADVDKDDDLDIILSTNSMIQVFRNTVPTSPTIQFELLDSLGVSGETIQVADIAVEDTVRLSAQITNIGESPLLISDFTLGAGLTLKDSIFMDSLFYQNQSVSIEFSYTNATLGADTVSAIFETNDPNNDPFEIKMAMMMVEVLKIDSITPSYHLSTLAQYDVISVYFDEAIDEGTIGDGTSVFLQGTVSGKLNTELLVNSNELQVTVSSPLIAGEKVELILTEDVKSISKHALLDGYKISYSTINTSGPFFFLKSFEDLSDDFSGDMDILDIGKDGLVDFITKGYRDYLNVYENNGKQDYNNTQFDFNYDTYVKSGDIDQDGTKDIISLIDEQLFWRSGMDLDSQDTLNITGIQNFEVVDIDLDGYVDIIAVEESSIGWYRNLGDGNFANSPNSIYDQIAHYNPICVLDADNDGHPDIVTYHGQSEDLILLKNDGREHFTLSTLPFTKDYGGGTIKANDINGDNLIDIFVESTYSRFGWLKNLGNGEFSYEIISFDINAFYVTPIDLDGDHDLDLIYRVGQNIFWSEQLTPEVFSTEELLFGTGNTVRYLEMIDADADEDLDFILGTDNAIAVFLNTNSVKSFTSFNGERALSIDSVDLMALSFNDEAIYNFSIENIGESNLEISNISISSGLTITHNIPATVVGEEVFTTTLTLIPSNLGSFSETISFSTNDPESPNYELKIYGEYNGLSVDHIYPEQTTPISVTDPISITFDQPIDVSSITSNSFVVHSARSGNVNGQVSVENSDSTIVFVADDKFLEGDELNIWVGDGITSATSLPLNNSFFAKYMVKAGVYPGDSIYFIPTQIGSAKSVSSLIGGFFMTTEDSIKIMQTSSHPLDTAKFIDPSNGTYEILSGQFNDINEAYSKDFDNDGDLDVFVNQFNMGLKLLENRDNDFVISDFFTSITSSQMQPEDLDNDLDQDIIVVDIFTNEIMIYQNIGSDEFELASTFQGSKMSIVDFDKNGLKDIIISNSFNVKLYLQNTPMKFKEETLLAVAGVDVVQAANLNQDQYLDLIFSEYINTTTKIALGGENGFNPAFTVLEKNGTIKLTDFDGDNNIDILIHSYDDQSVDIALNDGNGAFSVQNILTDKLVSNIEVLDVTDDGWADLIVSEVPDPTSVNQEIWLFELGFPIRYVVLDTSRSYSSGDILELGEIIEGTEKKFELYIYNEGELPLEVTDWTVPDFLSLDTIFEVGSKDTITLLISIDSSIPRELDDYLEFKTNASDDVFSLNITGTVVKTLSSNSPIHEWFNVYPVPTNDDLNLDIHHIGAIESYKILNLQGRTIRHQKLEVQIDRINLGGLSNGTYLLVLNSKKGEYRAKFIIK